MAHDAFISYSARDKATADAVCAALEGHGVRCWIAPRDVLPGAEWGKAIVNAIHGSQVMVMVFLASANESRHLRREVERAVSSGVTVVPFRIEDIAPCSALEFFIGDVHWLDALSPPLERHLNDLATKVSALFPKGSPASAPDETVRPPLSSAKVDRSASARPPTGFGQFCTQCGVSNPPASQFCTECGTMLVVAAKMCGQCGVPNSEAKAFCTSCGSLLTGGAQSCHDRQ